MDFFVVFAATASAEKERESEVYKFVIPSNLICLSIIY
jgi:hypothetical protein